MSGALGEKEGGERVHVLEDVVHADPNLVGHVVSLCDGFQVLVDEDGVGGLDFQFVHDLVGCERR